MLVPSRPLGVGFLVGSVGGVELMGVTFGSLRGGNDGRLV